MPKPPISAMPEMISSGMSVLARWMCSARGRICSSANRWKVSRTSSKSASRWRSPWVSASDARKAGVAVGGHERLGRGHPVGGDAPLAVPPDQCGRPGRPARRPRRRRRCGPRCRRGRRRRGPTRRCARRRRRGTRRRPAPGPGRARRRRPGRRCRTRRRTGPRRWRRRRRARSGAGSGRWSPHKDTGRPDGRTPTGPGRRSGQPGGRWATTVTRGGSTTGSSPGSTSVSTLQVVGHRPRSGPGRRLGPGVDDLQAGVAHERRAAGPRCRGAGRRAWRRAARRSARPR